MSRRVIGDSAIVALPVTLGVAKLIKRVTEQLPDANEQFVKSVFAIKHSGGDIDRG